MYFQKTCQYQISMKSVNPFSSYGFCHAPPPPDRKSKIRLPYVTRLNIMKIPWKFHQNRPSRFGVHTLHTYIHTSCFIYIDILKSRYFVTGCCIYRNTLGWFMNYYIYENLINMIKSFVKVDEKCFIDLNSFHKKVS